MTLLTVTILAGMDRAKLSFPGIAIRLIAVNYDIRPLFGVASVLRGIPIVTVIIEPLPAATLAVGNGLIAPASILTLPEGLDRGILSFDVTAAAYVIATVALAMTNKGSVALITGPFSATIGVLRSVTTSASSDTMSCLRVQQYVPLQWRYRGASAIVAAYYQMVQETQVDYDVLLVETQVMLS